MKCNKGDQVNKLMTVFLNMYTNSTDSADSTTNLELDVKSNVLHFRKEGVVMKTIPVTLNWTFSKTLELNWYVYP